MDSLIDAGMFRFTLPDELGGENASTTETIEVLEAISAIDASVGWNEKFPRTLYCCCP